MNRLKPYAPNDGEIESASFTHSDSCAAQESETWENARPGSPQSLPPHGETTQATHSSNVMEWDALLSFDSKHDPDCMMGRRYLGRTDGCVIVAPSGVGKSVLALQLSACAALGRHFFGMLIHKPLRVLYVQAEDSLGDVSEAVQGFVGAFHPSPDDLAALRERLRIVKWNDCAGASFLTKLRAEYECSPFDLVVVNPLFSFVGCNISEQKEVSPFLRNGLNPILNEIRAAVVFVHHTNKPPQDKNRPGTPADDELRYLGSGSSELTNWARSYITLQPVRAAGQDVYKLVFAKRGKRAGIVDDDGNSTTSTFIEHSKHGLCWLPSDWRPEQLEGGKFSKRFDFAAAAKVYDPKASWATNEAAIAASQSLTTRAVRRYRKDLETET